MLAPRGKDQVCGHPSSCGRQGALGSGTACDTQEARHRNSTFPPPWLGSAIEVSLRVRDNEADALDLGLSVLDESSEC